MAVEEVKTTDQYVVDLIEKMERVIDVAHENLKIVSKIYKKYFDRKSKVRRFEEGDKVLLLLLIKSNKLQLKWKGPFVVIEKVGENNKKSEVAEPIERITRIC